MLIVVYLKQKSKWIILKKCKNAPMGRFFVVSVDSSSDTGKIKIPVWGFVFLVALVGLEPTLLAELDFESSASTNSATGPWHQKANYLCSFLCVNFFYQTCTAVCLVNRFFCRCSRFASLFFNGFFNCSHFSC